MTFPGEVQSSVLNLFPKVMAPSTGNKEWRRQVNRNAIERNKILLLLPTLIFYCCYLVVDVVVACISFFFFSFSLVCYELLMTKWSWHASWPLPSNLLCIENQARLIINRSKQRYMWSPLLHTMHMIYQHFT